MADEIPGMEYWAEGEDLWQQDLEAIFGSLQDEVHLDLADALADQAAQLAENSRAAVESLQHRHVLEEQFAPQLAAFRQGNYGVQTTSAQAVENHATESSEATKGVHHQGEGQGP